MSASTGKFRTEAVGARTGGRPPWPALLEDLARSELRIEREDVAGAEQMVEGAARRAQDLDWTPLRVRVLLEQSHVASLSHRFEEAERTTSSTPLSLTASDLGSDSPVTHWARSHLAEAYFAEGDFASAKRHCEDALSVIVGSHGPDHPKLELARETSLGGARSPNPRPDRSRRGDGARAVVSGTALRSLTATSRGPKIETLSPLSARKKLTDCPGAGQSVLMPMIRIATTGTLAWLLAGCTGGGGGTDESETEASTGSSDLTGPGTAATDAQGDGTGGSSTNSGSGDEDTGRTSETEGTDDTGTGPELPSLDQVGVFSAAANYFELDVDGEPLKFHYGNGNSRWAWGAIALAGDWDGDGEDTVALFDHGTRSYALASENDSDEAEPSPTRIPVSGAPEPPPVGGEMVAELVVAGDWNGDGVDGLGLYHPASGTVYLIDDPTAGAVTGSLSLATSAGWPEAGFVVAGDWDGDGDDELGLLSDGSAYLAADVTGDSPSDVFAVSGARAVAGDWDGDGVDTLGVFDGASNEFSLLHHHGEGAMAEVVQLGHAEPGYWAWAPLAGRWQVPDAPVASDGYDWPEADPAAHGIDGAALEQALDDGASVFQVHSILVVRNGELVGERYFHGYDRHIAGNIKSVSKGVLSALYGIALADGTIPSLDAPVADALPGYFGGLGAEKQAITYADILTMRGGLQWSEGPAYVGGMIAAPDFVDFVLSQPLVSAPGSTYVYSTGLTHLASAALTEATGESTRDFARARLLEPLGITAARWDGSPEGYAVGGAELWMRPRDMARFGELYLAGGTLDDEAILDPEWVALSADPWIPEAGGRNYGVWWRERPWSSYPYDDSYFAWGHGGQFIFVFPSWDLQVVVTSKWNVDGATSGQSATAVFAWVDNQILPTVGD